MATRTTNRDHNIGDPGLFDLPVSGRQVTNTTLTGVLDHPGSANPGRQRSLDDLGTPLHRVTFCVIDLETTGGNRNTDMITEIGAVKIRGGETLGTFQTMVNPGIRIPAQITMLTGITESMVMRAPRVAEVLPSLMEFIENTGCDASAGRTVIVGHNVSFDLAFLNAALQRTDRPRLDFHVVDTLALAKRLIRDEIPNLRLATLARHVRASTQPTHRALDDALATGDVLHALLERAGAMGVLGLDDLMALPKIDAHPQAHKLALTNDLPRLPGVYLFHGRDGQVLYVGKASNLRTRVRSYFSGDRRRKVAQLLRETESISHIECPGPLEPDVTEIRLIHRHSPRFNRRSKSPTSYVYLKLTLNERYPRLSIATAVKDDGALYLGPLTSRSTARLAIDGIESVTPIRRCTRRSAATPSGGPCAGAQIGVTACPCSGFTTKDDYDRLIANIANELAVDSHHLLARIEAKMHTLAAAERFEEAADVRDRGAALAAILRRQRTFDMMRLAGRLTLEVPGTGGIELDGGRLVRSWTDDGDAPLFPVADFVVADEPDRGLGGRGSVVARADADELACVASWIDQHATRLRLLDVTGRLASAHPRLAGFVAGPGGYRRRER